MGLKSSKKPAMVLILILMIVTSLSILIVGALKVLTAVDSEYSINRNSSVNTSARLSGKFICYKKPDGNLYYQKVEYNVDGSIKLFTKEQNLKATPCIFDIPRGTKSFEITTVGGGGAGSYSSWKYEYKDYDAHNCIKENVNEILKLIEAKLDCKTTFPNGVSCISEYDYNRNEFTFDNFMQSLTLKENNTGVNNSCAESRGSIVLNPQEECNISYKVNNIRIAKSLSEYTLYNKSQNEIEENNLAKLIEKENFIQCIHRKPQYSICTGAHGSPGEAVTTVINGSIFGDRNGSSKIYIYPNDIGSGGSANVNPSLLTNGGNTVFKYWYKNSKGMKQLSITAHGGLKGSCVNRTITAPDQVETISSKEGIFPEAFEIPSVFNFTNQLYSGYYSGNNAMSATYFGASGASGYINNLKLSNLLANCEQKVINGTTIGSECTDSCNSNSSNCSIKGTDGAPGAIIISW